MDETQFKFALAAIVAFVAMFFDLRTGKIPNKLTFPAMLTGILYNLLLHRSFAAMGWSTLACLLGILFYFPFAAIGAVGFGDVKLLGAIGTISGSPMHIFTVWLFSMAYGFIQAIIVIYMNYGTKSLGVLYALYKTGAYKHRTIQMENTSEATKNNVKYRIGVSIALAALTACFKVYRW